jgi:hypothetical protein
MIIYGGSLIEVLASGETRNEAHMTLECCAHQVCVMTYVNIELASNGAVRGPTVFWDPSLRIVPRNLLTTLDSGEKFCGTPYTELSPGILTCRDPLDGTFVDDG